MSKPSDADPELLAWAGAVAGGTVTAARRITGGNRRQSWLIDVAWGDGGTRPLYLRYATGDGDQGADPYTLPREASVYRALAGSGIAIAPILAQHPQRPALLLEQMSGQSRFAGGGNPAELAEVATDLMRKVAALHRIDAARLDLPGFARADDMAGQVCAELTIWRAMYEESPTRDPLIDFALQWLDRHVPATPFPAVLVHGDTGPGNFLYEDGKVRALVDWELSHLGDPMEDLAWLAMRTTLEPVPDYAANLREYAAFSGNAIDPQRLRYHRVLVPLRVVIIRHRALATGTADGDRANSLISRTLNRRLLVEALAAAMGIERVDTDGAAVDVPVPDAQVDYDYVLDLLRQRIAPAAVDANSATAVKSAARMIKHLAAVHRFGGAAAAAATADLRALLDVGDGDPAALDAILSQRILADAIDPAAALAYFTRDAARATQLAASAMGALANRPMPAFA